MLIPSELSILPVRDTVLFPEVVMPFRVTRDASVTLLEPSEVGECRIIGIVTLKDRAVDVPKFSDLHAIGVAAAIRMLIKLPDGVRLIVHGLKRIRLLEPTQEEPYIRARVEVVEEVATFSGEEEVEAQALLQSIASGFQQVVRLSENLPDELQSISLNVRDPVILTDLVAAHMPLSLSEKQQLLEQLDFAGRLRDMSRMVKKELNALEMV